MGNNYQLFFLHLFRRGISEIWNSFRYLAELSLYHNYSFLGGLGLTEMVCVSCVLPGVAVYFHGPCSYLWKMIRQPYRCGAPDPRLVVLLLGGLRFRLVRLFKPSIPISVMR